jgi:uncharacterized protein with GYD domain
MAMYFLLGTLSHEGQRMLRNNPDLVTDTATSLDVEGARVLGQYAVLGHYDFVTLVQADENAAVARLSAEFGVRTGLHFETLSAVAVGFLADHDPSDPVAGERSVEMRSGSGG